MKPRLYNPLDYSSLSDSLARELMSADLVPLADIEKFYGDGVYALFIAAISRHMLNCQTLTSTVRGHFPFI